MPPTRGYGSGARLLSVGIASTGLLTFAYFSISSHVLGERQANRLDLLWSVMFVIISVIYRPIEQLLSRSIARGLALGRRPERLQVPMMIQGAFAAVFLILALSLHGTIANSVFDGSQALYWVLLIGTVAYAASYFARGWLAGHRHFGLYGGLVLMESCSRLCFAIAAAVGISSGQSAVAMGIAAAPLLSLVVVPAAFARTRPVRPARVSARTPVTVDEADAALAGPGAEAVQEAATHEELSLRHGARFAFAVSSIMLAEQTLLNAAVLTVDATSSSHILGGIVFNVLLIARAPLQLFQAIQTALLPHLAGLEATAGRAAFGRAVRLTVLSIWAFALAVALGLLAIGPPVMSHLFGQHHPYGRLGLAVIGLGMGLHLTAGTLNQAALARDRAAAAAACWALAALAFIGWMLAPVIGDQLLRTEVGYAGGAGLLALLLAVLYRRSAPAGSLPGTRDRPARVAPARPSRA